METKFTPSIQFVELLDARRSSCSASVRLALLVHFSLAFNLIGCLTIVFCLRAFESFFVNHVVPLCFHLASPIGLILQYREKWHKSNKSAFIIRPF